MSKYKEDEQHIQYINKINDTETNKLDIILMKIEKIEKLLLETFKGQSQEKKK